MRLSVAHAKVAIGIVVTMVALAIMPTSVALGINPAHCGQGTVLRAGTAGCMGALAAAPDPYRVVATYYHQGKRRPQDKRVMRLGTSAWGYTHIRSRRGWNPIETYVIVGCVLTYGKQISRQGHAYVFRYRFPGVPLGKLGGRAFEVIYETTSGPKGVITAYDADSG